MRKPKNSQNAEEMPLGLSKFGRIEKLLLRTGVSAYKDLVYMHGFLVALESGPNKISVDQWFVHMSPKTNYQMGSEATELLFLLDCFSHQIGCRLQMLKAEPLVVEPLIFEKGKLTPFLAASSKQIARWCDGYIDGAICLDDGVWTKSKQGRAVLMPISIMAGHFNLTVSLAKHVESLLGLHHLNLSALYQVKHVADLPRYISNNFHFCQLLKMDKWRKSGYVH